MSGLRTAFLAARLPVATRREPSAAFDALSQIHDDIGAIGFIFVKTLIDFIVLKAFIIIPHIPVSLDQAFDGEMQILVCW